ncbi:MAG: histidine kinase [Ramlibacter sp.]|nr:histidine kinase [Ramlibacter sp.]
MLDSQILSTLQETSPAPLSGSFSASLSASTERPRRALVFDACHVGVILRAVLFVETVMAVGAIFAATNIGDWLIRVAVMTAAVLPSILLWLIVACSLKKLLARLPNWGQQAFGIGLGALAGLYGCGLLAMGGYGPSIPWVASACTGALLAAAMVAALVLRAKTRMPADTAARLSELQARIRPHFLFNTLNTAIALVREEPAKAEAVLEDLSELFRHALEANPGDSVTLAQEITLARRYLEIEQVRFGERLQLEWALDPTAGSARVPPLMLQPLVENAVKHGVEPSAEGAQVKVSTQRRGGTVVIKVTNTVPGGQGVRGHGVAQHNVRDRLRLLHDVQGQFQAVMKDGMYQVRVEVPA